MGILGNNFVRKGGITIKTIEDYQRYFKFMLHHLIENYMAVKQLNNSYHIKKTLKKKKFRHKVYEDLRSQSLFYFTKIHNIVGDTTSNSLSYFALRKNILKRFPDIPHNTIGQDYETLIKDFKNNRDWSCHFTTNEFEAEISTLEDYYENKDILYHFNVSFVDNELFRSLIHYNEEELNKIEHVIKIAIQDYNIFFNANLEVFDTYASTMDLNSLTKAAKSYDNKKKKRHNDDLKQ